MERFISALENGAKEKNVRDNERAAVRAMLEKGIIYPTFKHGEQVYKLCNNVKMSKVNKKHEFEVVPNRYIAVVFDYDEIFECTSKDKKAPEIYCLTYALNPEEEMVRYFNLGDKVRVKVIARGSDIGNEGLAVRLPRSEEDFYKLEKAPCITTGLAEGAKPKNTANLKFEEPINGVFVEGRKALIVNNKIYYNFRDIDAVSKVYCLEEKNNVYILNDKCEKKIIGR